MALSDSTLTQEKIKEVLHYDLDTGVFVWLKRTSVRIMIGDTAGCVSKNGYYQIKALNIVSYAHRLAFLYMTGEWPKDQVDHINHIKTDNRWCNLRASTDKENRKNMPRQKNNTSGVNGVGWDSSRKKWISCIKINSKAIHLGRFSNFFDAVCARKSAENKYGFHSNHGT